MAISIDWGTKVITVPQADLTNLGGGLYELDVNQFRLDLKALEDDEAGMPFDDTHQHNTEIVLSGVTYARFVEIINGYTVEFEDLQYTVICVGANHNIADVKVQNQVSLIIGNSAGLVVIQAGASAAIIADAVWDEQRSEHTTVGSFGAVDEWTTQVDLNAIADQVWDEQRSEHTVTGSFGAVGQWSGVPFTPSEMADQVWDELRVGHQGAGSFGAVGEWASALTLAGIADAVWDEPRAGHTTDGTYGFVSQWTGVPSSPVPALTIALQVWDLARGLANDAGSFGAVSEWAGVPPTPPTPPTADAIADAVLTELVSDHDGVSGSLAELMRRLLDVAEADVNLTGSTLEVRKRSDNSLLFSKTVTGGSVVDADVEGP